MVNDLPCCAWAARQECIFQRLGYLSVNTHLANCCASAALTWVLAGMAIGPQTPPPPFMILVANLSAASFCPAYLLATSLRAGPTTFFSTAWHAKQFLEVASARSAMAGMVAPIVKAASKRVRFMVIFQTSAVHSE